MATSGTKFTTIFLTVNLKPRGLTSLSDFALQENHMNQQLLSWGLSLCLLCAPVAAMAQTDLALLTSSAPDRTAKLAAAAKAEGALTLYTSIAERDLKPLIEPFEKKYGVKVSTWRASGDSVMNRTINETRAKRYNVDVVHAGAVELEVLHREKMLQAVASPHFSELMAGSVPAHKEYATTIYSMWVQAYNTGTIKKGDLPKTYQELLDPKWKGRLGYEVENIDWFVTVVQSMGEAKGLQFFRDLASTNGISVRKGHTNLTNMVAAGEVPMALTVYNYMPEQLKKKGAPIDWTVLQPAVVRGNSVGVMKNAKNPAAAALFMDYLLGEGQQAYADLDYLPANTKISNNLRNYKMLVVDPEESLDRREKWRKLYDEIIMRGAK
jgi:iron(III) transport system substrate-binding protein